MHSFTMKDGDENRPTLSSEATGTNKSNIKYGPHFLLKIRRQFASLYLLQPSRFKIYANSKEASNGATRDTFSPVLSRETVHETLISERKEEINPETGTYKYFISNFIRKSQADREFICGWGAAFTNICVTFPINKVIFRQQLHGISTQVALSQIRNDGLRYLYRGLIPPLLQKTTSLSVMFGSYNRFKDWLTNERIILENVETNFERDLNHATAAMMAGMLEALLTPFERIQTLMQATHFHTKFRNTAHAIVKIPYRYGVSEYYRGLSIVLLRNGPSNVMFFLGREHIRAAFPVRESEAKKVVVDFISGACLGALISTLYYPVNVVKTHMQCQLGGPFRGIFFTFKEVYRDRGSLRALWRGGILNCTRSFLSWGIINASYEFLMTNCFGACEGLLPD